MPDNGSRSLSVSLDWQEIECHQQEHEVRGYHGREKMIEIDKYTASKTNTDPFVFQLLLSFKFPSWNEEVDGLSHGISLDVFFLNHTLAMDAI